MIPRRLHVPICLLALVGCQQELVLGEREGADERPEVVVVEGFEPVQIAFSHETGRYAGLEYLLFMITDVPGRLSCLAVGDTTVFPAPKGTQLWGLAFREFDGTRFPGECPVGEFVLVEKSRCGELLARNQLSESLFDDLVQCAVSRTWDFDSEMNVEEVVKSGLVKISEPDGTCRVATEFLFADGSSTSYEFSLNLEPEDDASCGVSLD